MPSIHTLGHQRGRGGLPCLSQLWQCLPPSSIGSFVGSKISMVPNPFSWTYCRYLQQDWRVPHIPATYAIRDYGSYSRDYLKHSFGRGSELECPRKLTKRYILILCTKITKKKAVFSVEKGGKCHGGGTMSEMSNPGKKYNERVRRILILSSLSSLMQQLGS